MKTEDFILGGLLVLLLVYAVFQKKKKNAISQEDRYADMGAPEAAGTPDDGDSASDGTRTTSTRSSNNNGASTPATPVARPTVRDYGTPNSDPVASGSSSRDSSTRSGSTTITRGSSTGVSTPAMRVVQPVTVKQPTVRDYGTPNSDPVVHYCKICGARSATPLASGVCDDCLGFKSYELEVRS